MDASISLAWLVNIVIVLLVAVASYFLKKAGDTLSQVSERGYKHDKDIALLQAEQVVQNTKIDQNADNSLTVGYGKNLWIATAGGLFYLSPDGISWTKSTASMSNDGSGGSSAINDVAYANGLFVAVGGTGRSYAASSLFGDLWITKLNVGAAAVLNVVESDGVNFVAAGNAGVMYTSTSNLTYSTLADLLDDTKAPAPGTFKYYAAGGMFRLGSSPVGTLTCDATEGAAIANRTTAQLYQKVLTRAGKTSGNWVAGDFTTHDTANGAECGIWISEETTFAAVCDLIVQSTDSSWYTDANGLFRIKQLLSPAGGTSILTITDTDLRLGGLERIATNEDGKGLPQYQTIINAVRNYTVQTTGLAGAVKADRRAFLAAEWRQAIATNTAIQTAHLLAPSIKGNSLFTTLSDATTEATRRQALREVQKDFFRATIEFDDASLAVDLSNVVTLQSSRFGLAAGKKFVVLGLEPDVATATLNLTLWG